MVSSGISTNINPVRTIENSVMGNNGKSASVEFGELMAQTMSSGIDVGNELSSPMQSNGSVVVDNASTDAAERIPKKEETVVSAKEKVKDQVACETKVNDADKAIREEIKEKFDVTDEDIDKALEMLGLTMADLLDKGNLMDFVVELTGMESSVDLLVMGDMSAKVDELFGFIRDTFAQLADEYGITVDEMADIFSEMTNVTEVEQEGPEVIIADTVEVKEQMPEVVVQTDNPKDESIADDKLSTKTSGLNESVAEADTMPEVKIVESKSGNETRQETFDGNHNTNNMQQGIINNLSEAITEAFNTNDFNQSIDPVQLINQIVETARLTLNQEVTSMEMMLNPENLGKINLNISVREGVVTATIVAQNETVREAIESQVIMLKDNLNNQGLKVEAVEVTVESHAFEANAQHGENNTFNSQQEEAKKKTNRPLRLDSLDDLQMEDLSEEERIVLDMMVENGNQINFKA